MNVLIVNGKKFRKMSEKILDKMRGISILLVGIPSSVISFSSAMILFISFITEETNKRLYLNSLRFIY